MYKKYDISRLRKMYRKHDISQSTRDVQEMHYLDVLRDECKKYVTPLPTTEVQKKYNISSSTRDVQEIIYLAVCDRNSTRNKTRKERAEKELTI